MRNNLSSEWIAVGKNTWWECEGEDQWQWWGLRAPLPQLYLVRVWCWRPVAVVRLKSSPCSSSTIPGESVTLKTSGGGEAEELLFLLNYTWWECDVEDQWRWWGWRAPLAPPPPRAGARPAVASSPSFSLSTGARAASSLSPQDLTQWKKECYFPSETLLFLFFSMDPEEKLELSSLMS